MARTVDAGGVNDVITLAHIIRVRRGAFQGRMKGDGKPDLYGELADEAERKDHNWSIRYTSGVYFFKYHLLEGVRRQVRRQGFASRLKDSPKVFRAVRV